MESLEFRFFYFTPLYDTTVEFYRKSLGLEVFNSWDRPDGDRGTIFHSPNGVGLIEIEAGEHLPSLLGGFYIEVENLDDWHSKLRQNGAPFRKQLSDTSYGHRNFKTVDPNGVEICFFQYLKKI